MGKERVLLVRCPLCEGKGKVTHSLSHALTLLVGFTHGWLRPLGQIRPEPRPSMMKTMEQSLHSIAEKLFTRKLFKVKNSTTYGRKSDPEVGYTG